MRAPLLKARHEPPRLARACPGRLDQGFETPVVDEITAAIAAASMMTDGDGHRTLVLRLGEIAGALTTILAGTLALSPRYARSPKAIRETAEQFRKKLIGQVRVAENNNDFYQFRERAFHDGARERGGNA
jgi:hypothetical protein